MVLVAQEPAVLDGDRGADAGRQGVAYAEVARAAHLAHLLQQPGRPRWTGGPPVGGQVGTIAYPSLNCTGTLTRVTSGSVTVRDLVRNRTVTVTAGTSYFAEAPAATPATSVPRP